MSLQGAVHKLTEPVQASTSTALRWSEPAARRAALGVYRTNPATIVFPSYFEASKGFVGSTFQPFKGVESTGLIVPWYLSRSHEILDLAPYWLAPYNMAPYWLYHQSGMYGLYGSYNNQLFLSQLQHDSLTHEYNSLTQEYNAFAREIGNLLQAPGLTPPPSRPMSAATPSSVSPEVERPTANERLRFILEHGDTDQAEPGAETPFEREIAKFVQEFGSLGLTEIYRVLFEGDDRPALGAEIVEALSILPRRIEREGRAAIFRASLRHPDPEVRFTAARALLTVRDEQTSQALASALEREQHPMLRRNLTQVLVSLESKSGSAVR